MNAAFLYAFAVTVLLLPGADAAAKVTTQAEKVSQINLGIHVDAFLTFQLGAGASYEPRIDFWTVPDPIGLEVRFYGQDAGRPVPFANVSRGAVVEGLQHWTADLASVQSGPPPGANFTVRIVYNSQTANEIVLRTWYPSDRLALAAIPDRGYSARIDPAVGAVEINDSGLLHGGVSPAAANWTHTVRFAAYAVGTSQDLNPYVWAGGGVLLGLVLFWLAVRQGWVSAPGRAKKFVKGGTMESGAMLEARRRTLLAALKELETAHEAKDVPDDAYGPLKEEYKAQAVRVMRSLEGKKEAP